MTIVVRRIREDESSVLKQMRLAALSDRPDAFGSTLEREVAFTDEVWAARAAESSAGEESSTFLAWVDDIPAGIVGGIRTGAAVELVSMWTSPDARRHGLGRRLVQEIVHWGNDVSADRVQLWVTTGNDSAQRLYASLGFVVTGDVKPLPSDPCRDEIRMVRPLTA